MAAALLGGSGCGLSWGCGLLWGCGQAISQVRSHLKARGCLPEFTHTLVSWTVGQRAQLLAMWISPQGCVSILQKWLLASPRTREKGRKGDRGIFYNLILKVTFHLFCCILWVTQTDLGAVWEGTMPRCKYPEARAFGAILETAYCIWVGFKAYKKLFKKELEKWIDSHIFIYDKVIYSVVGTGQSF